MPYSTHPSIHCVWTAGVHGIGRSVLQGACDLILRSVFPSRAVRRRQATEGVTTAAGPAAGPLGHRLLARAQSGQDLTAAVQESWESTCCLSPDPDPPVSEGSPSSTREGTGGTCGLPARVNAAMAEDHSRANSGGPGPFRPSPL